MEILDLRSWFAKIELWKQIKLKKSSKKNIKAFSFKKLESKEIQILNHMGRDSLSTPGGKL